MDGGTGDEEDGRVIFRRELARKIAAGTKTMTRRPIKDGEKTCRYREGHVYTVQSGRGQPATMHITILEVHQERLGAITLKDVRKEGFRTTLEFFEYWDRLHGGHDPEQLVWVISFAKGDVTDRPHLLAARSGGPGGDYTDNPSRAMKGEPEAVSGPALDHYAKDGQHQHASRLAEQRARLMAVAADIRSQASTPSARKRWKSIEHQLKALDNEAQGAA